MSERRDDIKDDMDELRDAFMNFATVLVKKVTQFVEEAIEKGEIDSSARRGGTSGRSSAKSKKSTPRRNSPNRKDQLLKMVRERPGLSLSEAGELAKTKPVAFARAASLLVAAGKVRKDADGRMYPA